MDSGARNSPTQKIPEIDAGSSSIGKYAVIEEQAIWMDKGRHT